ncbi:MAG TPA: hypothetical protein VK675_03105 [Candidatus Paceibacterota bacterium]|nr:hypothetical protein [Candidatus Paceibacterota bacterium]
MESKLEEKKEIKFNREKVKRFRDIMSNLRLKVFKKSPEDSERLEEEIYEFANSLKNKYDTDPKKSIDLKYAMWHALGGSTIDSNLELLIEKEDFEDKDGKDVVERFINGLVKRYV